MHPALGRGELVTDHGTVRADVVVRATEGYTSSLRGERRRFVPLYSLMIATEPLPAAVWDEIGLRRRETFADLRHMRIYGQRTADDRFAFGGRGAPYHFGSRTRPEFDRDERVHSMLRDVLVDLFPPVAGYAVTHRWGGALGVPRDWHASVGFDRGRGVAWAGGYVGDGVATANLAGRTLAQLITGRESELTRLPWVGHRSRALGARAAPLARRERRTRAPELGGPRRGAVRQARAQRQGLRALHRLLTQWLRRASMSSSFVISDRPSMPISAAALLQLLLGAVLVVLGLTALVADVLAAGLGVGDPRGLLLAGAVLAQLLVQLVVLDAGSVVLGWHRSRSFRCVRATYPSTGLKHSGPWPSATRLR